MLDFLKVFEKLHQKVCSVLRQCKVLHKEVRFEKVVHVRFAQTDDSERGANLLDEFFAYSRFLNGQHVLNASEYTDVYRRSTSQYLLKFFIFCNSFDSFAFFFNRIRKLARRELLVDKLDFFK